MNAPLPALQRRLLDLIAEYDEKAAGIDDACVAFRRSVDAMGMAATVAGAFVSTVVHGNPRVDEKCARRNLLQSAWKAAYDHIGLKEIAPASDRARFERELADPPPFTMDNLRATFGDYVLRPRFHILRGLAECFVGLDPAYKSHSKVKIGVKALPKRVILAGWQSYGGGWGRDRFRDMLNALAAYQGKPLATEHPEMQAVDALLREGGICDMTRPWVWQTGGYDRKTHELPARGVTVKHFQNGNIHVHFDETTLVDINRALAEFYGDVLPDVEDDKPTKPRASTAVAKDLQYYPTPTAVVDWLLSEIRIDPGMRVLEPSCGCGRILDGLAKRGARAIGIEVDPGRAAQARAKGHSVITGNFLEHPPHPDMLFDVVAMNPPFYGRHYVKHVRHALTFLKPGGVLAAILPATAHYDHGDLEGRWQDLPPASFAESGTNVPTGIMVIRSPKQ